MDDRVWLLKPVGLFYKGEGGGGEGKEGGRKKERRRMNGYGVGA